MNVKPVTRYIALGAGALAVCAGLALRQSAQMSVVATVDPSLRYVGFAGEALWYVLYYLLWAALAPFIFFLGRRVPFRRESWVWPLAFHAVASVVIAVTAPVSLAVLFGGAVLHRGYPDPGDLLTPFWTRYAAFRAIADTWMRTNRVGSRRSSRCLRLSRYKCSFPPACSVT